MNISEFYFSFGLGVALIIFLAIALLVFTFTIGNDYNTKRLEKQGSSIVPRFLMKWFYWMIESPSIWLAKKNVSPNAITVFSAIFAAFAGLFFALGLFQLAGWTLILCGVFDILDGWVARQLGQESNAGGFLDSTIDRFAEYFMFTGLLIYYRNIPWVLVMIFALAVSSTIFSYARAQGENHGWYQKTGFMQRHERFTVIIIGAILSPYVALLVEADTDRPFYHAMVFTIGMLAILVNYGAFNRLIVIFNTLKRIEVEKERENQK